MDKAQRENLLIPNSRINFASNTLVAVIPKSSNYRLKEFNDLLALDKIAIGLPASVPIGKYAKESLESLGLWQAISKKLIYGQNVRNVLDYVARAEVDAGFVYASDVLIADDKVKLSLKMPTTTKILYPIATIATSTNQNLSNKFIAFLTSRQGQEILLKYRFTLA